MTGTMQTRAFALLFGVVYLLVGIIGFIPALYTTPAANAPHLDVTASYGYLLSIFPINALHDVVHMAVGLAGIIAASRFVLARYYSMALFFVFGLLCIFGFIPTLNTLFGLVPLFGDDTWLHAGTALAGAYFGFVAAEDTNVAPTASHVLQH